MVVANERRYHHRKWTSRRPPSRPIRRPVRSPFSHRNWTNFSGPVKLYARTPQGHLLAATDGTTSWIAGLDRHGDLTYLSTPDGTIDATTNYDPFGNVDGTSGANPIALGFQSDLTDSGTGQVPPAWQSSGCYPGGKYDKQTPMISFSADDGFYFGRTGDALHFKAGAPSMGAMSKIVGC